MTDGAGQQNQRWAVPLMVLVMGTFLAVLGTSVVNVAIPYIQKDLGVAQADVRWVSTAYLLSLGVAVPLSGWLGQRLGLTRVFLASLVVYTIASALCGIAWDLPSLLVFRVLQAFPGGIISVVALTLLYQIVPPARLGVAMGLYGLGVILAPALGPVLGGWLVEVASWHAIFFATVPVGLLAITAATVLLPRPRPDSWPRFDSLGYLTIALGLIGLMLAADRGPDPEWGWTDYRVLMLAVFGVLCLALFVVIEFEVEDPLVNLRVFANPLFCVSAVLTAINSIGMFALLYYVPQFLLTVRGYEALESGMLLVPSALAMAVMGPIAGQLVDRFGPRWPAVVGLALSAYGSLLLSGVTLDTPRSDLILWTTVRNIGVGLSMMPCMSAGLSALPPKMLASGSAMSNVVLRVSSSLGVAGFGGLVSVQYAQLMADRMGLLVGRTAPPSLNEATQHGAEGVLPFYEQLSAHVTTATYGDAFYVLTLLTAASGVLALVLPSRVRQPAQPPTIQRRAAQQPAGQHPATQQPAGQRPSGTNDSGARRGPVTQRGRAELPEPRPGELVGVQEQLHGSSVASPR